MVRQLILASASPRRAELIQSLSLPFRVVPSDCEEVAAGEMLARDVALARARQKARDVAGRFPQELVLGADTVVCCDGVILGKPHNYQSAAGMLKQLSGRVHEVSTGVVLIEGMTGRKREEIVTTKVTFRNLRAEEIAGYLATGEPFDKAGGYGIQGLGALLVECVDGCFYNVVGLPLAKLGEMLDSLGVNLLCPDLNIT